MSIRATKIELSVYADAETGAVHVLQSPEEDAQTEATITGWEQQARELAASDTIAERLRGLELRFQAEDERENLRKTCLLHRHAKRFRLTLAKPTYAAFREARADAAVYDDNSGETTIDESPLLEALLTFDRVKEGLTRAEWDDLPPNVLTALWDQFYTSCFPNHDNLPTYIVAAHSVVTGQRTNTAPLPYIVELTLAMRSLHGLPEPLWSLPCDLAELILTIDDELTALLAQTQSQNQHSTADQAATY